MQPTARDEIRLAGKLLVIFYAVHLGACYFSCIKIEIAVIFNPDVVHQ